MGFAERHFSTVPLSECDIPATDRETIRFLTALALEKPEIFQLLLSRTTRGIGRGRAAA